MSTRLSKILEGLSDRSKYVRVPDVAVFDEHEEVYHVDAEGNPCRKGAPGARRRVRRFDKAALAKIAARCNERDRTGSLSPLTFGHTVSGGPEESQPEPRGYATRYRVRYDPDLERHVISADFYVRKDQFDKAKTYPRVSIELWPDHGVIDPIALLRRTPQRDLGQWHYDRAGRPVLRYQMESTMANPRRYEAEEDLFDDVPADEPAHAEPDGDEMSDDEVEQYMRHCYSHELADKYARHCKKKYGMAEGAGPMPAAEPPMPDPTGDPDADEPAAPPMKNSMASAPSATNSGVTGKYGRRAEAIRYAKLEEQVKKLQREAEQARAAKAEAEAAGEVMQLVAEGYVFKDYDAEVARFAKLGEAERRERAAWIRDNGRRAPVGGSFLPVAGASGTPADVEDSPESMPAADLAAVKRYRRESGDWDSPLAAAAAKALPQKYGRKEGDR